MKKLPNWITGCDDPLWVKVIALTLGVVTLLGVAIIVLTEMLK